MTSFLLGHVYQSRWMHRPRANGEKYAKCNDPSCIEDHDYQGLQELITLRKENESFSGNELDIVPSGNDHILGFMRRHMGKRAVIFASFAESLQNISSRLFEQSSINANKIVHGISRIASCNEMTIEPLGFLVF